jgi:transposase
MSYKIAGMEIHKRMVAVVIADVAGEGEYQFERRKFGCGGEPLRLLAEWLVANEIEEVVMESTAQYWKPVWESLERDWQPVSRARAAGAKSGSLLLAQAKSNRAPRGRKNDFADAERLLKRLVANELVLSFVSDTEQRLWRTVSRQKRQLTRARVRLQNQLEALLEQAQRKLSSLVSDLLGVSARRMLQALADGESDPGRLAALAHGRLRATPEQLCDALGAAAQLSAVYRRLLQMLLDELTLQERHREQLDQELSGLLTAHHSAIQRLAEVPGLGLDSAQQILAEVGANAAAFPSAKNLASWVGVCPGEEQSAEVSKSARSPKGNRNLRRLLNQAAHAAVKTKGSVFEWVFGRLRTRLAYREAIWAIAHRLCRLIWKILHQGVAYEERGPAVSLKSKRNRATRMIRELRKLGYRVEPIGAIASNV